jgi:hypothetical protein
VVGECDQISDSWQQRGRQEGLSHRDNFSPQPGVRSLADNYTWMQLVHANKTATETQPEIHLRRSVALRHAACQAQDTVLDKKHVARRGVCQPSVPRCCFSVEIGHGAQCGTFLFKRRVLGSLSGRHIEHQRRRHPNSIRDDMTGSYIWEYRRNPLHTRAPRVPGCPLTGS